MFKKFLEGFGANTILVALVINSWITFIVGLTLLVEFRQGDLMGAVLVISAAIGFLFGVVRILICTKNSLKEVIQRFRGKA